MIYLVIIGCVFIATISVIHLFKVNKYRMTENEIEQYLRCMVEYEEITSIIEDIGDDFIKQYDEATNINSFFYSHIYKHIKNLEKEYMRLIEIKLPEKYTQLYTQLVYADCVRDISDSLAFATFDPILDKNVGGYFPPHELLDYVLKLEDELKNPYYIPKDISRPNFEQILYKIQVEYLEGDKSASEIYDELHEIFYNEQFIKDLK